jgi:hypothetical protein
MLIGVNPCLIKFFGREKTMFIKRFILVCLTISACLLGTAANAELVSRWEFSGNANDSQGLNNGTLMNGASIGTDPVHGQVLMLDGINDYVDCGNDASLDVGSGSFTVAAWGKRPATNSVYDIVAKRDPTAPYTGWSFEMFWWYDNQWHTKLWTPQENGTELDYDFAPDTWYHVAAVRDAVNSQISYYVNGHLEVTLPFSNADLSNNAKLTIGQLSEEYIHNFAGPIDDVRIYNHALTAQEIAAIVPEPATLVMLGIGGIVLRMRRGR